MDPKGHVTETGEAGASLGERGITVGGVGAPLEDEVAGPSLGTGDFFGEGGITAEGVGTPLGTGVPVAFLVEGVTAGEVGTSLAVGVIDALLGAGAPLEEGRATAKGVGVTLSDGVAEASVGEGVMAAKAGISLGSGVAGDSLGVRIAEALLGERGATDWGAESTVRGGVAGPLLGG